MKLIVGLGNPGSQYVDTRHNAGFMVLERLVSGLDQPITPRTKFHARVGEIAIAHQPCLLIEPMTYMNRSGTAVAEAVRFYKVDPSADLLVVVDDVALTVGRLRLRPSGSAGGHNGLLDIERALGTRCYPRLRIGIDPPGRIPQVHYVLGRFTSEQREQLELALDQACEAIRCWVSQGIDDVMNRFNRADAASS